MIMICTKCHAAELIHDTRDLSYGTARGAAVTIHSITGDFCPVCGEMHLDMAELFLSSAAKSWPRTGEVRQALLTFA
jgi:HTH-type transcriptional regulator/antitoxin MqsA